MQPTDEALFFAHSKNRNDGEEAPDGIRGAYLHYHDLSKKTSALRGKGGSKSTFKIQAWGVWAKKTIHYIIKESAPLMEPAPSVCFSWVYVRVCESSPMHPKERHPPTTLFRPISPLSRGTSEAQDESVLYIRWWDLFCES